jgi:nucleoid-associated protein YgaU
MDRYKNTPITRIAENGKLGPKVYRQSNIPNYAPDSRDTYFYARESDRLDSLANEFYGDVTLWPVIASANNLGKGTLSCTPGQLIRIPYDRNFVF